MIGRRKMDSFDLIKSKEWNRLNGWKEKLFSKSGKEILIKAVAQKRISWVILSFPIIVH